MRLKLQESKTPCGRDGWPECDIHLAGWAPIVSSRFTFSMIGLAALKNAQTANLLTSEHKRHIAHLQIRETKDATRKSNHQSQTFCYLAAETNEATQLRPNIADKLSLTQCPIATASSSKVKCALSPKELQTVADPKGKLSGFVCMFFPGETIQETEEPLNGALYDKVVEFNAFSKASPKINGDLNTNELMQASANGHSKSFMELASEEINARIESGKNSIWTARFELHRSGELRLFLFAEGLPSKNPIALSDDEFNIIEGHETLSKYLIKGEKKINLPATEYIKDDVPIFLKYRLQREAEFLFDFIRDTVHTHYHHEPVDDRMVGAYHVKPDDDYSWRLKTMQGLMDAVQRKRDERHPLGLANASGILSYTKAFQNNIASVIRGGKKFGSFYENTKLKPHNLRHLESSLNIEAERLNKNEAQIREFCIVLLTITLAVLAVYISIMSRLPYKAESAKLYDKITTFVVQTPSLAIYFIFLLAIPIWLMLMPNAKNWIFSLPIIRTFSVRYNRKISAKIIDFTSRKKLKGSLLFWGRVRVAVNGILLLLLLSTGIFLAGAFLLKYPPIMSFFGI